MNQRSFPFPALRPGIGFALTLAWAATPLAAQRMELSDPQAAPVVVQSATISTEVSGRIAVTTFDLVFSNPNGRVLEGTFQFPLLGGQSVVRFALDVNGRLREAVPVEKDRARVVFEEIERRGADPGLIEQTAGNNYRARVYPIPARGSRRVVIAYQEDVGRGAGDPFYRLNLDFEHPLQHFRLTATVFTGDGSPAEARTTLPLELPHWRDGRFLEVERTDFAARGLLELKLPKIEHPRVLTERRGELEYYYAEVPLVAAAPQARKAPHVVGLLWDGSGSGRTRDHAREFALLDAWFAALGNVEVRLVELRDHASAPAKYTVHGGDWSALRRELENTVYDGATSLDGLADDPAVDEWLLFSDGLVNYGATPVSAPLPFRGAVHAILASPRADPAWLRGLARRQHGEFVNLLETEPARAAAILRSESWRVLGVGHDPEAVAQVFPEPGSPVPEGTLVVTGILRRPDATLRLKLGHNAGDAREVTVTIRSGENPSRLAARAWATAKIAWLSADPAANREDIRRTSRDFGIVTPDTSLIVLENVDDYLRYDITPPEELLAEWTARRRETASGVQKNRDQHLEAVVRLFNERIAWWEQKISKNKPPRLPEEAVTPSEPLSWDRAEARTRAVASTQAALPAFASANAPASDMAAGEAIRLGAFAVQADSSGAGYRGSGTLAGARASVPSAVGGNIPSLAYDASAAPSLARDEAKAADGEAVGSGSQTPAGAITLQRWSPQAGYLDRLRRAEPEQRYGVYLEERADHARQPGFFLDVAEFFFEQKDTDTALRILSNLAELELEDPALLRVLAHRLDQAGRPDLAEPVFARVLQLRPEEPQSRRDLALVCAELKQYQRAVDLLWEVVDQPWDARFPEIELIALSELNAIAATCGQPLDLSQVDRRLRKNLPVGLRAILTWDADDCDIDLWVVDPSGETAKYDNPLTRQGGRMSRDFTAGYGPEEFIVRHPQAGTYQVKINYFGDRRQTALGPVTVQVRLLTDFGLPTQKEQRITVRLVDPKETLDIGSIEINTRK
jgi:tetratricopeptide (TPR) repeat protein